MTTITTASLLKLMQLTSVSLPVGGYAFSQGLELAVEKGWVTNAEQAQAWLEIQLTDAVARVDLPILKRVYETLSADMDDESRQQQLSYYNHMALACRETAELRLTDTAMGDALKRLLPNVGVTLPQAFHGYGVEVSVEVSFVVLFAYAAHVWQVPMHSAMTGFAWSWIENQVAAATKLIPLGQTQAQQLLLQLQAVVDGALETANQLQDDQLGASLPALAIASCQHEVQYTRLFRS